MFGFSSGETRPARFAAPARPTARSGGERRANFSRAPPAGPRRGPALLAGAGAGPGPAQDGVRGRRRPGGPGERRAVVNGAGRAGGQRPGSAGVAREHCPGSRAAEAKGPSRGARQGVRRQGQRAGRWPAWGVGGTWAAGGDQGLRGHARPGPPPGSGQRGPARPAAARSSPDVRAGRRQDVLLHRDLLPVEDQVRVAEAGLLAERAERSQQTRGMLRIGHGAALCHRGARLSAVRSSCPSRPAGPLELPASGARPVCTVRARARPSGPALSARRRSGSPRNAPAPSAALGAGAFKEPRRCVISPRRPRALGPALSPVVAGGSQSEASFLRWPSW